ncbi:MAG: hypothetical protein LBE25_13600 [Arthrobacter sp.]|jgi:hypothetical protein|nr:hypothetical protein [Arthrobacter sp.]
MKPRIHHIWIFPTFDYTVIWGVTYDGTTWSTDSWADALKLAQLLTRKGTP